MQLSSQELILIAVIVAALLLIVSGRLRTDLVALLVLITLPLTGIITFQQAFLGFSSPAVLTILGLFIISQALEDTGIVQWVANRIRRMGRGSEMRLVTLFMIVGAGLSLVMSTIAAGAVLLPAAVQVARESKVPVSKILIPLAFGTLLGGMSTYFTSANIIISGILRDQGQSPLGMSDFLFTGGLIALAGFVFMALIGRRWLPAHESSASTMTAYTLSQNLYRTYQLEDRLWEVQVLPESRLSSRTLEQSTIGTELGLTVLAIWRGPRVLPNPPASEKIIPGDLLMILGREDRVTLMDDWGVVIQRHDDNGGQHDFNVDLTEVVIPPRSGVVGRTLTDIRFRNKYGLTTVALWREGRAYRTDVGKMPLRLGDALLMVGTPANIRSLSQERDFLVLQSGHAFRPPLPHKAVWALLITALVLLVSIFEITPTAEAVLIGVVGLAFTGCIDLDEAYRAIQWQVIFLIAGMLPISIAMVNTGLGTRLGAALVTAASPFGPLALIAALYLLTMAVAQVIGAQVTALVVGPVAVTAALQTGIDPQAVAVAVAIASSAAFLTPIAHPVNVIMMGPGDYTFGDFFKVGLGLAVVAFVGMLVGMRLFWGV